MKCDCLNIFVWSEKLNPLPAEEDHLLETLTKFGEKGDRAAQPPKQLHNRPRNRQLKRRL